MSVCKGCEILLLTTFILPYNILRQFGTAAPSWNTCLKLKWLRHKKFQNSFTCTKLVHAYKQHLTGLAELIKLCLCSGSPQSLSQFLLSSASDAGYCIKSKGYKDGIQNISKQATYLLLKQALLFCWKRKSLQTNLFPSTWEIDVTVFTLTMSNREATDIMASLISYLGFIDRPKKIQKTEEIVYADND